MKKSRKGVKVTQGIIVNDLKINIYEMKKEYEVHVIFKNKENIEKKMDKTIDYLAEEGYFDGKKKVKVYLSRDCQASQQRGCVQFSYCQSEIRPSLHR